MNQYGGTVLLVQQDHHQARSIGQALTLLGGHRVLWVPSAIDAFESFSTYRPDLVLISLSPSLGVAVDMCVSMKQERRVPVVMMGDRDRGRYLVRCFESGADDVLAEPIDPHELVARVAARLRRSPLFQRTLTTGPFVLDPIAGLARRGNTPLALTPMEFNLFHELARTPMQVRQSSELARSLWQKIDRGSAQQLRTLVKRLRQKVEDDQRRPRHLQTVRGIGYKYMP